MTDEELNIRLRDLGIYSADMAADRIENLLTEQSNLVVAAHRQGYDQARAVSSELRRAMADRIEELEAKLAKAVEGLREWDDLIKHQYSGSREAMSDMTYAAQHTAALLAEIEGEKT